MDPSSMPTGANVAEHCMFGPPNLKKSGHSLLMNFNSGPRWLQGVIPRSSEESGWGAFSEAAPRSLARRSG